MVNRLKLRLDVRLFGLMCACFLLLAAAGCGRSDEKLTLDKIRVVHGGNQCALPGEKYEEKLIVELQGPERYNMFGAVSRRSLSNEKVLFTLVDNSDLVLSATEGVSNAGGEVAIDVTAGKVIGDQYLKAIPVKYPEKSVTVRFVSGIKIYGGRQEGIANQFLQEPVKILVVSEEGKPLADVPVYFNPGDGTDASRRPVLSNSYAVTNAEGFAETSIKVGEETGTYRINAEIADRNRNIFIRGVRVDVLGLSYMSLIVNVLGGLALFIFGMKLMSDGLEQVAGNRMKSILQFFARNRFVAVGAGTAVTAVIQSSSATSVMVIGFVNAGLLNLVQAIGIVLGADIGTTVTAQIISMNLSMLALPAIIIGTGMVVFGGKKAFKGWGMAILGFGLLFFGLTMMGTELKQMGNFPSFIQFFSLFDCSPGTAGIMPLPQVLGAFGIGLFLTLVIQSSSASIGILLMLCGSGLVNFYTAMPLMLGANVGTTVTAVIAAIPSNVYGKQVALSHVLVKALGTIWMIVFFYVKWPGSDVPMFLQLVDVMTEGDVFAVQPQNVVRHVANAHTIFNIVNVMIFIPLIGPMAKLCEWALKPKDTASVTFNVLEPKLLDVPAVALEQTIQTLRAMVSESWDMVSDAVNNHFRKGVVEEDSALQLARRENEIDRQQGAITEYLVQLSRRQLAEDQAFVIPMLIHCTNDAERIADHTANILQLTERLEGLPHDISDYARGELNKLWDILEDQAKNVIAALNEPHPEQYVEKALLEEERINILCQDYEKNHITRLSSGECQPQVGVIFIELLSELERVGDHLTNIAERAPKIQQHFLIN